MRFIRRQWLIVALVPIAFAAGGFIYSATRETTYQATAQLAFRALPTDPTLVRLGLATQEPPAQQAAANAQLMRGAAVAGRAKRHLDTDLSLAELQRAVSARLLPGNFAVLAARAGRADFAAELANAYAHAIRSVALNSERARLQRDENTIQDQIQEEKAAAETGVGQIRLAQLQQALPRVQALEQSAQPVQIVRLAQPPPPTTTSQPSRDTILGGVVGLVLGLLAAFVRDSLDRRLRTAQEVREELGLPVLGRISDTVLGRAGLARNGSPPMADADFEPFRVLRMNLAYLATGQALRSVLITSGLPEEGKSTVSMSLASATAVAGQRTLLVECDLRRPSFAQRLGVAAEPGLTDYLLGRAAPGEVLQTVELGEPARLNGTDAEAEGPAIGTLVCITAGAEAANPAELLIGDRFRGFLDKVTKAYDLVVLDSSPLLVAADPLEIVPQVDGVILCVRAQQTTRDEARAARAALEHVPERPIGAVLTGVPRHGPDSDDYYHGY